MVYGHGLLRFFYILFICYHYVKSHAKRMEDSQVNIDGTTSSPSPLLVSYIHWENGKEMRSSSAKGPLLLWTAIHCYD